MALVLKEKTMSETWVEVPDTEDPRPPVLPPPAVGRGKFVQAFTDAVGVRIPGTLHGLGTADLVVQFYDSEGATLPVGTLKVDPVTYDVGFTLLSMQSGRVVLLA